MADKTPESSFFGRHEFLIRRLHSLSGLIPVGAFMCVHLAVNASIWNGAATFQRAVYQIHSLGRLLPVVEWGFIFLPILFHAIVGVLIMAGGKSNLGHYRYRNNVRYVLQRISGVIALIFIAWHVLHMHGWIHVDAWIGMLRESGLGALFYPYSASSSASESLSFSAHPLVSIAYLIGITACVYHLANGLWTMGITWGLWISPASQHRANLVCSGLGVALMAVALAAWSGFSFGRGGNLEEMNRIETRMFEAKVEAGELDGEAPEVEHKRRPPAETEVEARARDVLPRPAPSS